MKQPNEPRALLLDLDGTIADTLPHVFDAYRHAVAPWVERPPTDAEIEATFGPSERECIAVMVPGADLDEAVERFHSYHEEHHGRASRSSRASSRSSTRPAAWGGGSACSPARGVGPPSSAWSSSGSGTGSSTSSRGAT